MPKQKHTTANGNGRSSSTELRKLDENTVSLNKDKAQPRLSSAEWRAVSNDSSINGHITDFFYDDLFRESSVSIETQALSPPPSSEPLPPIVFSHSRGFDNLERNVMKENKLQQYEDRKDQGPENKSKMYEDSAHSNPNEAEMLAFLNRPILRENSLDYMLCKSSSCHTAENTVLPRKPTLELQKVSYPAAPTKQLEPHTTTPKCFGCPPQDVDVLLGRGGMTNRHAGNVRFRKEAKKLKSLYTSSSKADKYHISVLLVSRVHGYGGRFLGRDKTTKQWCEVGKQRARKKASQALRENKVRNSST